jgi:hypothetical protein
MPDKQTRKFHEGRCGDRFRITEDSEPIRAEFRNEATRVASTTREMVKLTLRAGELWDIAITGGGSFSLSREEPADSNFYEVDPKYLEGVGANWEYDSSCLPQR